MARIAMGKGLDALFNDHIDASTEKDGFVEIRLSEIEPNRNQPRKDFDKEQLEALAASVKIHGVIQPILVCPGENGYYTIIAGERRWRAARMAGLTTIPAVVRDYDTRENMEIALIENLQREGLNPIEEAAGYKNLMDSFSLTQEQIGERMGKSRSAIANSLRLLSLPDAVIKMVSEGKITGGHARALLSVEDSIDKIELAGKIAAENLSVRDIEKKVSAMKKVKNPKQKKPRKNDAEYREIESSLSSLLGTRVTIVNHEKKGKLEIEYYSQDDLEKILSYFGK
jgi:ParB family chromosome partitioning protein